MSVNGVSSWSELPWSPNLILPNPSDPKHIENELEINPCCAKMLGTDFLVIPSPNRPLIAAPVKNAPVWTWPQLHESGQSTKFLIWFGVVKSRWIDGTQEGRNAVINSTGTEKYTYPSKIRALVALGLLSSVSKCNTSSTKYPFDSVLSER